jgi:hypothetical protein
VIKNLDFVIKACDREMSALSQKQTSRSAIAMSALPPKADMCGPTRDIPLWARSGHEGNRQDRRPRRSDQDTNGATCQFVAIERPGSPFSSPALPLELQD